MMRIALTAMMILTLIGSTSHSADDPAKIELISPLPNQVLQREGFESVDSHEHSVFGATLGFTDVEVEGTLPEGIDGTMEYRISSVVNDPKRREVWKEFAVEFEGRTFHGPVEINAGGWYRLDIRCTREDKTLAEGSIEPIGIGEVFLIAGQSYAAGENDELLKVTDPQARVTIFDWEKKQWQVANDPLPNVGTGGTIWPALGDLLVPTLRVPVGFVNVAVSGTSSQQWMPGGDLHNRLLKVGKEIGSFRAVLWQQGESDVLAKTPTETYVKNLTRIREVAARAWRFEPTWLLAKSTLHPTVYNDPEGEERIRKAIHQLWKLPHFAPGPDTDLLAGENRGDEKSRRHFSAIGQRRAALLWFVAIWNEIEKQSK